MTTLPALVVTSGEPAGIGPDLCIDAARHSLPARIAFLGDPNLFQQRAERLGVEVTVACLDQSEPVPEHRPGVLHLYPEALAVASQAGTLNPANSTYVLNQLDRAVDHCVEGRADGMVTAPVQKSVIADAGVVFSGHTEYLAARLDVRIPVMLLAGPQLRVALVTTHLPLSEVASAITAPRLSETLTVLHADLINRFGIAEPRICVLGLNPHAGEAGHLGREEIEVISPVIEELRALGMNLTGPVPADTAFVAAMNGQADAVLAMYHDQGLPVIKTLGFGEVVNVTLGLPIIRTSVDHGTALDIAGTGQGSSTSFVAAIALAAELAARK